MRKRNGAKSWKCWKCWGFSAGSDNERLVKTETVSQIPKRVSECAPSRALIRLIRERLQLTPALTADDFRIIRAQARRGISRAAIASAFRVSPAIVLTIVSQRPRLEAVNQQLTARA